MLCQHISSCSCWLISTFISIGKDLNLGVLDFFAHTAMKSVTNLYCFSTLIRGSTHEVSGHLEHVWVFSVGWVLYSFCPVHHEFVDNFILTFNQIQISTQASANLQAYHEYWLHKTNKWKLKEERQTAVYPDHEWVKCTGTGVECKAVWSYTVEPDELSWLQWFWIKYFETIELR